MLQQVTLFFESFDTKSILEMSWTSDSCTQQTQPHAKKKTTHKRPSRGFDRENISLIYFTLVDVQGNQTTPHWLRANI